MLMGREAETRTLTEFAAQVRAGRGGTLVLEGEVGVGKSRLLDVAAGLCAELTVIRVAGVEAELPLTFAGLHRVLAPLPPRLELLPGPQAEALRVAFGLVAGSPPDRFLVGLATLGLLTALAAERPLLCVVDDVHWLDRESVEVLAFVARRLGAEPLGMLLSTREPVPALDSFPVLAVRGLAAPEARGLLASAAHSPLDDGVAEVLADETEGNPLALLTLAAGLSPQQLAGHTPLPAPLPLGPRLRAYLLERVRALPLPTQSLLLVAACAPPHDQSLLWRAAALLGLSPADADAAVEEGILHVNDLLSGTVAFHHPLARSAVYGAAHLADRRRVHLALARASTAVQDEDTRAWHQAAATAGPEEAVAADLERAAERARTRGGYSAQARFLAKAAELSPDPAGRDRRLLAAAAASLTAGDAGAAGRLVERALPGLSTPVPRAVAQRIKARIETARERPAHAPALLLAAVATVGDQDEKLARLMAREAMEAALISREHTAGVTLEEVADAVLAVRPVSEVDLLVQAAATRVRSGFLAAVPGMKRAVAALAGDAEITEEGMPVAIVGSYSADDLWDERARRALLARIERFDRDNGALSALKVTLVCQATGEVWAGRFHRAQARLAEIADLDSVTGELGKGPAWEIELLAWQGSADLTRQTATLLTETLARRNGLAATADQAAVAMTVLELSLGNYRQALSWAKPLFDSDPIGHGNRALADLVEAAGRAGEPEVAEAGLARLTERAVAAGTPWALGLLARARALVTGEESCYLEAVDRFAVTDLATERARTQLLYGEWLRRRKQRAEARTRLRTAYEMFTAMGATLFADRARVELAAAGEHVTPRVGAPPDPLTTQEAQIAALAAEGATNAEIAARLYLTSSTVEYHLTKIFRKLRLTSRRQLRGLGGFPDSPAPRPGV
ncbi:AAA family ATPase [Streptosporangium sp. NPDC051023]|uniref:ATP-binding protein n=1 Tax=Streptosporangium sp. NPDC051023 TaxID=3155410 RepID=UPI00344B3408